MHYSEFINKELTFLNINADLFSLITIPINTYIDEEVTKIYIFREKGKFIESPLRFKVEIKKEFECKLQYIYKTEIQTRYINRKLTNIEIEYLLMILGNFSTNEN